MYDQEKSVIIGYLLNLLQIPHCKPAVVHEICEYLESEEKLLDEEAERFGDEMDSLLPEGEAGRLARKAADEIRMFLVALLRKRRRSFSRLESGRFERNLTMLSQHLGLDTIEGSFLGLLVRHGEYDGFSRFLNAITREHLPVTETCAACLGIDVEGLSRRLGPTARLQSLGIVTPARRTGIDLDDAYQVLDTVCRALLQTDGPLDELLDGILGRPCEPSLSWDDFEHLGDMSDRVAAFVRKAVGEKLPGVNILLWGSPGTGKTEFCKTLASELGVRLFSVGERGEAGEEPDRKERMALYRLSQNLLRYQPDTLLMFDEMDDLFAGSALARLFGIPASGSKVFMNRLLESNPTPTVWIVNDVGILDEAFLRRMALAVEIRNPPASTRERVWKRVMQKHALDLPDEEMRRLADLNIPPAVVDSAARFTRQIGGSADDFQFAARGIIRVMRGGRPLPEPEKAEDFLPELTCPDIDLELLTERLLRTDIRAFSLCLYGPPGTGKSAFVRHLAAILQMPILFKRASDLMAAYVGETEKSIADAFREAVEKEAFLVFDEADSLLGDRRFAARSWEISQVNEMLTWMERHPFPFACTTNLLDRLDEASLRRFTFKCHFNHLRDEQLGTAFRYFFGSEAPKEMLGGLSGLTPGDFSVAAKKATILGMHQDPAMSVELLRQELKMKEHRPTRAIGFTKH